MKTISQEELNQILEDHKKWLQDKHNDNFKRADLSGLDLRHLILNGADLKQADLSGTYLSTKNLRGADLSGADLSGTIMSGTDFSHIRL